MTVVRLDLAGLPPAAADQAVTDLIDHRSGPARLERVIVIDAAAGLAGRAALYERLVTGYRVRALLCVAVGRPGTHDGRLPLPPSLGNTQGDGLLWVSDTHGIDWLIDSREPVANGRTEGGNGLERLVDLLMVDEIFDQVHLAFDGKVPGRVASPGLRLAGAEDESATFAAGLTEAMRRLIASGSGPDGPFPALLPDVAGGAVLADTGSVARYRDEGILRAGDAGKAIDELASVRGRLRRGDAGLAESLVETHAALGDLRDLVTRLFREANTVGPLTENQRRLVLSAGVTFDRQGAARPPAPATSHLAGQSLLPAVIAASVGGGDTLALAARRLTLTAREVKRNGSGSYLPEVEKACPAGVLDRLATDDPKRLVRASGAAAARHALGIDDVEWSARRLADLVVSVANREWSPSVPSHDSVNLARIALGGIATALAEQADKGGGPSRIRGARLTRLVDSLLPVLRDLVLRVVADEASSPSKDGEEAFRQAHGRTLRLLTEWLQLVRTDGVTVSPPFATSGQYGLVPDIEDDIAEIKDALLYPADGEMWQLCEPSDLAVLDETASPQALRFASRLNREALAGTLPTGDVTWTSTGSYAGLLRLIPFKPGTAYLDPAGRSAAQAPSAPQPRVP